MAAGWQRQQEHSLTLQQQHVHPHQAVNAAHDRHAPPIASTSATCSQCRLVQSVFYCTTCLSERIILQHADRRRLGEARQRARDRVDILLGIVEAPTRSSIASDAQLPNPFIESVKKGQRRGTRLTAPITAEHHGASIQDRTARATIFQLKTEVDRNASLTSALKVQTTERRRQVSERRQQLDRRKAHLKTVGSDDQKGSIISRSYVEMLKPKVEELQAESTGLAAEMTERRAHLASAAYAIFSIQAPPSLSSIANKAKDARVQASISNRSQRSKERYSGGAFAIDFGSAFDLGKTFRESRIKDDSSRSSDWTILGLALPTPTDIFRIDRAEINGALFHTVQLLQLVTAYLGITLPFVLSMQGSLPQIRANPLWGAGSKETLHVSEATYNSICQSSGATVPITVGSMGASMMSTLGASTLSTLESFVQLPSAKHLPWSKGEAATTTSIKNNDKTAASPQSQGSPQLTQDDPSTINARRFCTALTMLSFDVAYLVHLQGVKIDLIMAAGNTLRLISRAMQSPDLGKVSHVAFIRASSLSTLQIPTIDFAQLSQIHDTSSSNNKGKLTGTDKKDLAATTIMEESYVDAKKAAESILNLDQKSSVVQKAVLPSNVASTRSNPDKMSSLAAKRIQASDLPLQRVSEVEAFSTVSKNRQIGKGGLPPGGNTLDFLRARGQRDTKVSPAPVPNAGKVLGKDKVDSSTRMSAVPTPSSTRGTVTFNGKEVRGKSKATVKGGVHRTEEDGWHVL